MPDVNFLTRRLTPQDWSVLGETVLRLGVENITPLHGGTNSVFLLHRNGGNLVAKYPQSGIDAAYTAAGEAPRLQLVGDLLDSGRIELPVQVPRLVEYNPSNYLRTMTALKGFSENGRAIPLYFESLGENNGEIFGQIAAGLSQIPPEQFIRTVPNPFLDWDPLIQRVAEYNHPSMPRLTAACRKAAAQLKLHYPHGTSANSPIVILSDLTKDNVLVNLDPQKGSMGHISGLVDLEGLFMGDEARSLRFLFDPSEPAILQSALDSYEKTIDKPFDRQLIMEKIESWAKLSNFLMFTHQLNRTKPVIKLLLQTHLRLVNLNPPAEEWGELFTAVQQTITTSGGDNQDIEDYCATYYDNLYYSNSTRRAQGLGERALLPR